MIKVIVSGAAGKMGREVCRAVDSESDLELVGAVDLTRKGEKISDLIHVNDVAIEITDNLKETVTMTGADVVVDFTHPDAVMNNIKTILESQANAVVGTTGISEKDLGQIEEWCSTYKKNALIAPNFAIGAVLMMKMAGMASKIMKDVEIIELHHEQKADAPSGTSIKTAEVIGESRGYQETGKKEETRPARGKSVKDVQIHSVRLPGLVAHQTVIFGGQGQTLTITHDSLDRTSFMPGVITAVREVMERPGLTYGLDKVLPL